MWNSIKASFSNDEDLSSRRREYFKDHVKINHLKRVIVHYGPNGQSLGSVTVIFHKAEDAGQATAALEGIKIDKKPLRVEMLVSAAKVPVQAQPSLADRRAS